MRKLGSVGLGSHVLGGGVETRLQVMVWKVQAGRQGRGQREREQ